MTSFVSKVVGSLVFAACLGASLPATAMDPAEDEAIVTQKLTSPSAVIWTRQFGTSDVDWAAGVATGPAGNVLIAGIEGEFSVGGTGNLFVAKHDGRSGARFWKRRFSDFPRWPLVNGIATDARGNVLIAGEAWDGLNDAFVAKYTISGRLLWKRYLGRSADYDAANGVATDTDGNVLIAGNTSGSLGGHNQGSDDAFVAKYSASGDLLWKRQIGSHNRDNARGVATDAHGNVLIAGNTSGSLGGHNQGSDDAFVAKYSASGDLLWTRQISSPQRDGANGVATDTYGNVLIAGQTGGSLGGDNQGLDDAFVAKYGPSGLLVWKRQIGSPRHDGANGIATDTDGNVLIAGQTGGSLGGHNQGSDDAFVAKYSAPGNLVWTRQIGSPQDDGATGVATDAHGNVLIAGQSDSDAFVTKLRP